MSDVSTKVGIRPEIQGMSGVKSDLASLWREFRNGKMSVEEFNAEMRNTSGAIYAQRRAVMLMRTEYRNQRAALYEAMRGFRAVARIGRTLTSTYTTYTLMQTRVADKTRDVRDAQEDLAAVQVRRTKVVAELGVNNAIAMRLMDEEDRLTRRLEEDRRGLKQAQDQNIIGYAGIALQALAVIPTMVSLKRHLDLTRLYLGESWSYAGLTGIVTAAYNAELAVLGIATTVGALIELVAIPIAVVLAIEWLTSYPEVMDWLEGVEHLMYDWWVDLGERMRISWDDWMTDLFGPLTVPPGSDEPGASELTPEEWEDLHFPDEGNEGAGGLTDEEWEELHAPDDDAESAGGGLDVTVDGDEVEVDVTVDVTVKPKAGGGGGSTLR